MPDTDTQRQRDEAKRFNEDLLKNKSLLLAFASLLIKPYDNPDALDAAANEFIRKKSENGVSDYDTDYDTVIDVQKVMQMYSLIYWNGFYGTSIVDPNGGDNKKGPDLVIAATLNADDPYHIGFDKAQIIDATFETLTLKWDKSDVQNTSGKLIFSLVPTKSGGIARTLYGSWTDASNDKHILIGTENTDAETTAEEAKEKFSLPPALQVIFPVISAIAQVTVVVGGVIGAAWIGKQWREKIRENRKLKLKLKEDPDDEDLADRLEAGEKEEGRLSRLRGRITSKLRKSSEAVDDIKMEDFEGVGDQLDSGELHAPPPGVVKKAVLKMKEEEEDEDFSDALDDLAEEVEASSVVKPSGEDDGAGVGLEDGGLLTSEESEGVL